MKEDNQTPEELKPIPPTAKYKAPKWKKNSCRLVWDNAKEKESHCKTKNQLYQIKK